MILSICSLLVDIFSEEGKRQEQLYYTQNDIFRQAIYLPSPNVRRYHEPFFIAQILIVVCNSYNPRPCPPLGVPELLDCICPVNLLDARGDS